MRFPIYALRAYTSIFEFEGFVIIGSRFKDYVLDCPALEGDYYDRRRQLLGMELAFPLYPLKERYTCLSQLVNSKRRWFIDAEGTIIRYRPTEFYTVEYAKVLSAERTWNGKVRLTTKLPVSFITEGCAAYVGYIRVGAGYVLYELSDEKKPTTRKKL